MRQWRMERVWKNRCINLLIRIKSRQNQDYVKKEFKTKDKEIF